MKKIKQFFVNVGLRIKSNLWGFIWRSALLILAVVFMVFMVVSSFTRKSFVKPVSAFASSSPSSFDYSLYKTPALQSNVLLSSCVFPHSFSTPDSYLPSFRPNIPFNTKITIRNTTSTTISVDAFPTVLDKAFYYDYLLIDSSVFSASPPDYCSVFIIDGGYNSFAVYRPFGYSYIFSPNNSSNHNIFIVSVFSGPSGSSVNTFVTNNIKTGSFRACDFYLSFVNFDSPNFSLYFSSLFSIFCINYFHSSSTPSISDFYYGSYGYSVGSATGGSYSSGYAAGVAAGRNEALTEGLKNPISFILEPVVTFFNIKLFGVVSIGSILSVAIFVAVAIIFLKMFAGG